MSLGNNGWKILSIILIIALVLSIGYIVYDKLIVERMGGGSPSLKEVASFLREVAELERKGYDVYYVEYLLLSARYHYANGDKETAIELFHKARDELENVVLLPVLPSINYSVADNTLYIKKIPGKWDFVPLGTVFVLSQRGYLVYPRNDRSWKLSCFIIIAIGFDENNQPVFMYQGRLPLIPREVPLGGFVPKIYVDGEWIEPDDMRFVGPLYYDDGSGRYGYPTVYEYDLSGRYLEYLMYIPHNRTWIHEIVDVVEDKTLLEIRAQAIGAPMWLGIWNETYLPHGVYAKARGVDLWAGFWDIGIMEARVYIGGKERVYHGVFVFDRASHRAHQAASEKNLGSPLAFSCMVIYQPGINIMIASSENPSPWDPGFHLEHQVRINLLDQRLVLDTTNFTLQDDGNPQPRIFRLYGTLSNGYFNLTGEVIGYWPEKWVVSQGVWWNNEGAAVWGRAFIHWTGVIVVNGHKINIDAYGAGEFTRYTSQCQASERDSNECWCR
ncbi:hypothetical protein J4526_07490 [Desulfurococcaceae archaeon MEX13E-LK6-19]|nr:hypothetical protein J4526_07490 [Desulfurococcaceae archaeon MEX13E-LK6-19]